MYGGCTRVETVVADAGGADELFGADSALNVCPSMGMYVHLVNVCPSSALNVFSSSALIVYPFMSIYSTDLYLGVIIPK